MTEWRFQVEIPSCLSTYQWLLMIFDASRRFFAAHISSGQCHARFRGQRSAFEPSWAPSTEGRRWGPGVTSTWSELLGQLHLDAKMFMLGIGIYNPDLFESKQDFSDSIDMTIRVGTVASR